MKKYAAVILCLLNSFVPSFSAFRKKENVGKISYSETENNKDNLKSTKQELNFDKNKLERVKTTSTDTDYIAVEKLISSNFDKTDYNNDSFESFDDFINNNPDLTNENKGNKKNEESKRVNPKPRRKNNFKYEEDFVDRAARKYKKFFREHPNLEFCKDLIIVSSIYRFLSDFAHKKLATYGFNKRFSDVTKYSSYDVKVKAFLREAFIFSRYYRFTNILNPADGLLNLTYGVDLATLRGISSRAEASASRMQIIEHGNCVQSALVMKYWMDKLGIHNFLAIKKGHFFVIFNDGEGCSGKWKVIDLVPYQERSTRLGIKYDWYDYGILTERQINEKVKNLSFFDRIQEKNRLQKEKTEKYKEFAKYKINSDMIPNLDDQIDMDKIYIISDNERFIPYEIFSKVNPDYFNTVFEKNGLNLASYIVGIKASTPDSKYLKKQ